MKVIDLSDWKDNVDWDAVAKICGGMIVKISEGTNLTSLYAKHISSAIGYGLKWGVFCYTHAQTTEEAREEARTVIQALASIGAPTMGIWFDVEAPEVIGQSPEDVTAVCSAFISECNAAGYSAGIYGSYDTLTNKMNVNDLADYVQFWAAQYGSSSCSFKDENPNKSVAGWQFTETYNISGIDYDMSEWF